MKSLNQYINEVSSDLLKRAHNEQVRRNNGAESNRSRKFAKGAHAALDREMSLDDSVSGTERQYDYVDLGLPSGTMWATCNVGASKPEDEGLLFQFGRVDGYKYGDRKNQFRTKEQNKQDTGDAYIPLTTSGKIYKKFEILDLEDDAAHVNMGGVWRMPTRNECEELLDNTLHKVETIDGVKGMMLTSKINLNKLFIPFAQGWWDNGKWKNWNGYCVYMRSSQVDESYLYCTYSLMCNAKGGGDISDTNCSVTFSVRGLFKK